MSRPELHSDLDDAGDVQATVNTLYRQWISAIQRRDFDWFERHLAEDYTCTAHPFKNWFMDKHEFIEADKKVGTIEVEFVNVFAHRVGDVVLSNLVIRVLEEAHTSDPGAGLPSAAELSRTVTGKTVAYASAWRQVGADWQCYDHHMIGPID